MGELCVSWLFGHQEHHSCKKKRFFSCSVIKSSYLYPPQFFCCASHCISNTVFVQIIDRNNLRPFQDFFLKVRPFFYGRIFARIRYSPIPHPPPSSSRTEGGRWGLLFPLIHTTPPTLLHCPLFFFSSPFFIAWGWVLHPHTHNSLYTKTLQFFDTNHPLFFFRNFFFPLIFF